MSQDRPGRALLQHPVPTVSRPRSGRAVDEGTSICNGQWQAFSQYEVKPPIGYVWLADPAGCYTHTTMTRLYCSLATRLVNI